LWLLRVCQGKCVVPATSDSACKVIECYARSAGAGEVRGDVVVAAAQVLHEGVPRSEDAGRAVAFQASLRPQPCVQPSVVCFNRIVRMPVNGVHG
jgi:hypothetical protein